MDGRSYLRGSFTLRCFQRLSCPDVATQLSNLCEDARSRYLDSGEEIAALAADLSTGLARLQDAFAEVQVIFDDAQNAFDDMQLPETGAEETEEEA